MQYLHKAGLTLSNSDIVPDSGKTSNHPSSAYCALMTLGKKIISSGLGRSDDSMSAFYSVLTCSLPLLAFFKLYVKRPR